MQINSTQAAGFAAFVPAALAALVAIRTQPHARRYWRGIAAVFVLATIELVAGLRHRASGALSAVLRLEGVYSERRPAQAVLLVVVAMVAAAALVAIVRRAPGARSALAAGASAALVLLFAVELVSLHQTDALLYRAAGPFMAIGWLWLGCGWAVVAAALTRPR